VGTYINQQLLFGPFRLDPGNVVLWYEAKVVNLPPKAFALFHYLLMHPGRLLTKDALLDASWPRRYVSESVLKGCINELRKVLADDPRSPRYIETVAKHGYRFIAEVKPADSGRADASELLPLAAYRAWHSACSTHWVGRRNDLAWLEARLERARHGDRQLVFFTGEAGIGKTTLIEMFLARVNSPNPALLRARCVEQCGVGEAFMPLLEALERRYRDAEGQRLIDRLRRHAPTWLMQMTSVLTPADKDKLKQEVLGATSARMLREAAEFFESISSECPLILVIEDLHWSDYATLDLISLLGRRRARAQLFVIATYRPVDVILAQHPVRRIRQELQARGLCGELAVNGLCEDEVGEYLISRYPEERKHETFSSSIYRWTEGHPFFMVNLVDHLLELGRLSPHSDQESLSLGIPDNLLEMIGAQIERLNMFERRLLEMASAIGVEWSAALLAAVSGEDLATVELCCEELSRRGQMLKSCGGDEWADGTVSGRYGFRHSLYREVFYRRLAAGRRMQLHQSIGECLEIVYGEKSRTIAAELANHFEQGRQLSKAVVYLRLAAENAMQRYANREAVDYINRALGLSESLPETERSALSIELLLKRGVVKRTMDDMDGAVEHFSAGCALARAADQRLWEIEALMEQCKVFYFVDRSRCLSVAAEAVERCRDLTDETIKIQVRGSCAGWNINLRG